MIGNHDAADYRKTARPYRGSIVAPIAIIAAALVASCATIVKAPSVMEAERFLPPDAVAYARLDKATLSAALAAVPGSDAKSAATIADRTDAMTAAFVRSKGARPGGLVAVAEGRYPAGAASLKLSSDTSWKKNGAVWERKDGSMRLAFADGGRVFFGTAPIDGLIAAAAAPNENPIPPRWTDAWSAQVAVYLPDPMTLLRERLPLGDGAVPMVSMVLSCAQARSGGYTATLYFEFESERAAVVFLPLCRVFLYAAATALWPERAATVLDSAEWQVADGVVSASGFPLDAESIAAFIGTAGA